MMLVAKSNRNFFSQMQMISQSKGNVNFSCKYRTFFVNLCNLKKLLTSINKQKKLFFWRQRYDLQRVERTKTQCYKPNHKCDDEQGGLVFFLLAQMIKLAQLSQKGPEILAFEGHKGCKAKKGQEGQKNKYGSKCLELSNSARNAKIAKKFKKCQRPGGVWILGQMAFGFGITSIYM